MCPWCHGDYRLLYSHTEMCFYSSATIVDSLTRRRLKNPEFWPVASFPTKRGKKKKGTHSGIILCSFIAFCFGLIFVKRHFSFFFFFSYGERESFRSRRLGSFIIDLESVKSQTY